MRRRVWSTGRWATLPLALLLLGPAACGSSGKAATAAKHAEAPRAPDVDACLSKLPDVRGARG